MPDSTDSYWPVADDLRPAGSSVSVQKEPLGTGLFVDDPLLPIVESLPDPRTFLTDLVDAGWQASDAVLFENEDVYRQLLDGLADGCEMELISYGTGDATIGQAIEAAIGVGGGTLQCDQRVIIGGVFQTVCTGAWGPGTPGTQPVTGGCITVNSYAAPVTKVESRRIRKIYTNCTTCLMTQTRSRTGTARLKEQDDTVDCPPPAGYASPPASIAPCDAVNIIWGGWSTWTPPAPGQPGSPCV